MIRIIVLFSGVLILSSCERKTSPKALIEGASDSIPMTENILRSPITHGDTPIWYYNESENLIIEEIAETIPENQVFLNELAIADYPKTPDNLPESFVLTQHDDQIDIANYRNVKDSVWVQYSQGKLTFLEFKNYSNTDFRLEDLPVFQITLDDYKKRYPGSYSLRNLFPSYLFQDYNKLDSVETIDLTFLWVEGARMDIIWLNKYAAHVEFRFF
ncbi:MULTISPECIES: hypothetical protein [unclassified Algoriphagus]|uniref:hypothetical protein n=1 Tax=unclassified Algoriphagus TaxID=2641541 RepID=UPI00257F51F4|nr:MULTISPECIES: hypothetical protein [unclassified Algoriphagus]